MTEKTKGKVRKLSCNAGVRFGRCRSSDEPEGSIKHVHCGCEAEKRSTGDPNKRQSTLIRFRFSLKRPLNDHENCFLPPFSVCTPLVFIFANRFRLNVMGGYYVVKVRPHTLNEWLHTVMIYNGPNTEIRLLVSGEVRTTDTLHDKTTERNSGRVIIGKRYLEVNGRYCSSMVDELRLWNRSLTVEEAEHLMALY